MKHGNQQTPTESFNTQPPEGGWQCSQSHAVQCGRFNTQPPEGGWVRISPPRTSKPVSTHSRPKAAGPDDRPLALAHLGFNTQPPEGGWPSGDSTISGKRLFQHTAARRRLENLGQAVALSACFNTQPPEGGWVPRRRAQSSMPCFNTQPPEGGWQSLATLSSRNDGFNTQPPEGGWGGSEKEAVSVFVFQHTAARRRLGSLVLHHSLDSVVSTHSRPKAAGLLISQHLIMILLFQHTAARRRLANHDVCCH